jgi:uncharacterized coiled-coil DUF342 family protein
MGIGSNEERQEGNTMSAVKTLLRDAENWLQAEANNTTGELAATARLIDKLATALREREQQLSELSAQYATDLGLLSDAREQLRETREALEEIAEIAKHPGFASRSGEPSEALGIIHEIATNGRAG